MSERSDMKDAKIALELEVYTLREQRDALFSTVEKLQAQVQAASGSHASHCSDALLWISC